MMEREMLRFLIACCVTNDIYARGAYISDEYEDMVDRGEKKRKNALRRHFIGPAVSSRHNMTCYKQGLRI